MATKVEKQTAIECYVKAQTEMGKALKNASNPHFRSQYADLGNVLEACMKPFNDNGFALSQPSGRDEHGDFVMTILHHITGESYSTKVYLVLDKQTMQGLGSAITYARRYGALQMAGIAPEDDDANEASTQPRKNLPIPPKKEEEF
jgi:hypothetical protein|tara:strand:+ start:144 stop:581 length:438 start_codon:yes stop_codon:yes gene_type:complete